MSLQSLMRIVPPPANPVDVGGPTRWKAVCEELGLMLPKDYYDLCRTYGSGHFVDGRRLSIELLNPFDEAYLAKIEHDCSAYREMKEIEGPRYFVLDIHPDRPGLLPWGRDDNGCSMFWLTVGQRHRWPVFLNAGMDPDFTRIDVNVTDFLLALFTQKVRLDMWPKPLFTDKKRLSFRPAKR